MTRPLTLRAARGPIAVTMALLIITNALVWVWAWRAFHGHPTLLGTALLAWMFGLRHAVDADHIAAIDNVVRKLVQSRRRAWDSGLFFALGHSTTVLLLCLGIIAVPSVHGIERLRDAADVWGTLLSALFLLLIGMANLLTLRRLWRARDGGSSEANAPGGVMSQVLRPVQRLVGRTWHMLPVGFLFGLGFDTASEVALLALTAQQAAAGLSAADLLIFPAMFAAGMVLIDTTDSAVMTGAYGWALREPGRKLTYNIAVTALSVCVALGVGGLELLGLLAAQTAGVIGQTPWLTWLLDAMGSYAGFVVVALLLLLWGIAVLGWRSRIRLAN
jgi:high-affinity nickel-transport protein